MENRLTEQIAVKLEINNPITQNNYKKIINELIIKLPPLNGYRYLKYGEVPKKRDLFYDQNINEWQNVDEAILTIAKSFGNPKYLFWAIPLRKI